MHTREVFRRTVLETAAEDASLLSDSKYTDLTRDRG